MVNAKISFAGKKMSVPKCGQVFRLTQNTGATFWCRALKAQSRQVIDSRVSRVSQTNSIRSHIV